MKPVDDRETRGTRETQEGREGGGRRVTSLLKERQVGQGDEMKHAERGAEAERRQRLEGTPSCLRSCGNVPPSRRGREGGGGHPLAGGGVGVRVPRRVLLGPLCQPLLATLHQRCEPLRRSLRETERWGTRGAKGVRCKGSKPGEMKAMHCYGIAGNSVRGLTGREEEGHPQGALIFDQGGIEEK